MRPLRPFALEVFFSKWEFTARYHLCASDMQSMTLSDLLAMADAADRAAWDQLYLGYTETWGSPTLRESIAATYDTITPDHVLTFVGAEEGIPQKKNLTQADGATAIFAGASGLYHQRRGRQRGLGGYRARYVEGAR